MEHIAEAKFRSGIAGSMHFRWLKSEKSFNSDLMIFSDLYHTQDSNRYFHSFVKKIFLLIPKFSRHFHKSLQSSHSWKIYATDIFDQTTDRIEENCNVLQVIYDPQNYGAGNSIGDIDLRVGQLNVSEDIQKLSIRQMFRDDQLQLLPADLNGPSRKLYVVIYDHKNDFLSCAKIRQIDARVAKTFVNANGIKGELTLTQRSKFEPIWLNFTFGAIDGSLRSNFEFAKNIAGFKIHDLPPSPLHANSSFYCATTGKIYNPRDLENDKLPPPGLSTQDQYFVGDLSGKLTGRNKMEKHNYVIPDGTNELSGIYWDIFLPLFGRNSVVHRGFVLSEFDRSVPENISERSIDCGVLSLYEENQIYQLPMTTAQVLFRYPIVGKILFRQPKDQPWHDTSIIVEYLIHADGASVNNSDSHRWSIQLHPPGKDFYSWQNRCLSTGDIYNPYKVTFDMKSPEKTCSKENQDLCRLGDLSRLETINIAGKKADALSYSRKMFTDSNLPLSGFSSIFGKSVVIFDEHGPVARGERLACAM